MVSLIDLYRHINLHTMASPVFPNVNIERKTQNTVACAVKPVGIRSRPYSNGTLAAATPYIDYAATGISRLVCCQTLVLEQASGQLRLVQRTAPRTSRA